MKKKRYNKTLLLKKHLYHRGLQNIEIIRDTIVEAAFSDFMDAKYIGRAIYKGQALETLGDTKHEVLINLLWIAQEIDNEEIGIER